MFTGIIQDLGRVTALTQRGGDCRIEVATDTAAALALGDSVAVSGVCLTVVEVLADGFAADVSRETLTLTSLGALVEQAPVNIEPALRAGDPLGGHWVSGHVDGLCELRSIEEDARSVRMRFSIPQGLARYLARKGSVTLDGISLTVNDVGAGSFGVNIVPHTLRATTLGERRAGDRLNMEVDMLARYVERLLHNEEQDEPCH